MDYTYSYSGADCRAYAFFPGSPENMIDLSSLATISISVHEAKSPVRRLGERGVSGYTRGIRTIAGSMVFLVIEDHPLWKLIHYNINYIPRTSYISTDWNRDSDRNRSLSRINQRKLSTMIRPFNIMLVYQTEVIKNKYIENGTNTIHNEKASLMIEKIDILNEGLVTSVNDMVTEVQMQFVAQDYYSLEKEEEIKIFEKQKELKRKITDYRARLEPGEKITIQDATEVLEEEKARQTAEIFKGRISDEELKKIEEIHKEKPWEEKTYEEKLIDSSFDKLWNIKK